MEISVKTSDETIKISAEPGWTCLQLKEAISKKVGSPASALKLTLGGKIMKDAKVIGEEYKAAATQVVNLVIKQVEGAAPAAGAKGKSTERMQVDGIVNEIISMVKKNKEANVMYEKYKGDVPDTTDLQAALGVDGLESVKTKVLDELTKVLEGDWTAFDQYHEPLRKYGMKLLDTDEVSTEKRDAWVEKAASMALDKFAEYPAVKEHMDNDSKEGRDMVKELVPVAKKCARRLMDLFLDGPNERFAADHPTFSSQLRLLVVTTVGAILDGIIDCLADGKPKCQALMAKVTGMVIDKLAEKMPDYSTLFAFAGPMTMNQIMMWHEEYLKSIKGKTFP